MAEVSWEQLQTSNNGEGFDVGFFSLKGDGAEAIVRIMCDTMSDIKILTVHPITVGASSFANRQVNCLRDPREPLDKCPLCAMGEKVKQKCFIKMIQYDDMGVGKAVVWDRPAGVYVPKLKSYMDNYGPLSNIMCKIVRHGSGLDTTYDIIPNINPQVYNEANFPKNTNAFNNFDVLGRMVMDKTADEINTFINTGSFPEGVKEESSQVQATTYPTQGYSQPNMAVPNFTSPDSPASWEMTSGGLGEAPIRRY